jgi:hypothetical protein
MALGALTWSILKGPTRGPSRLAIVARKQTPEEERRIRDAGLDHTLEETFPASDPPSTLPNPAW